MCMIFSQQHMSLPYGWEDYSNCRSCMAEPAAQRNCLGPEAGYDIGGLQNWYFGPGLACAYTLSIGALECPFSS